MFEYKDIKINWFGHSSFELSDGSIVYIDPYRVRPRRTADIVLVSHDHFDHCSRSDIQKISTPNTVIVTTRVCKDKLSGLDARFIVVEPGKRVAVNNIAVEAVAAYNINKFRSPGVPYHAKGSGIGFIVTLAGVRVYHAGDTDFIPEMNELKGKVDIALLPVSGTYVMTAEEAAAAVDAIEPAVAVPMHYGSVVGSIVDAKEFEKLAKCRVEILKPE